MKIKLMILAVSAMFILAGTYANPSSKQPTVKAKPVAIAQPIKPLPTPQPLPPVIPPAPKVAPRLPAPPAIQPIYDTYPIALRNAPLNSVVDQFGMYNRGCVSYTAAKVQQTYGNMPNWTTYDQAAAPNAVRWPSLASAAGFASGGSAKVHSVAIALPGQAIGHGLVASSTGHAMWVEQLNVDGTIKISQYNRDDDGAFSTDTINATGLTYIYF